MTMTTVSHRRPPLWVYGGEKPATDEFKQSDRCKCINQRHYFFSDDLQEKATAIGLCASCPMLHPCTRWTLENYLLLPEGIFAGMDATRRKRIYYGEEVFYDWAREFNLAQRKAKAAYRQQEKRGIKKRDQRAREVPACEKCGSPKVRRVGRDRLTNRQYYRCKTCKTRFLGEEL